MFEAEGYELDGDHVDLSFSDTRSWPRVGKNVVAQSLWLSVGDPISGPGVQLGVSRPQPKTPDRWLGTHYHGSDQFRVLFEGEFLLHGKRMAPGQFAFQEAGKPYREGVAGADADSHESWMFLVHGDRRGARATVVLENGTYELADGDLREVQLDRPVPLADDPYWKDLPGGSKGVPGVITTLSEKRKATIGGSFDDRNGWQTLSEGVVAAAGVVGNAQTGPFVLTIHAEPRTLVIPAATYGAEVICAVMRGGARIGGAHYDKGAIRVQNADVELGMIESGPDGLELVFVITDRRAKPKAARNAARASQWVETVDRLYARLGLSI